MTGFKESIIHSKGFYTFRQNAKFRQNQNGISEDHFRISVDNPDKSMTTE